MGGGSKNSLTVTDNRTGKSYELSILDGNVIRAMDLRQIRVDPDEFGMMAYDPAFTNTASTRSTVTEIDGGKGILRYRGYPIEQLAERSSFLEVAYLILKGELPSGSELDAFVNRQAELVDMIPGSRRHVIANRGAFMFYEDPLACAEVIGDFLARE